MLGGADRNDRARKMQNDAHRKLHKKVKLQEESIMTRIKQQKRMQDYYLKDVSGNVLKFEQKIYRIRKM
jgi:hypothetical protein